MSVQAGDTKKGPLVTNGLSRGAVTLLLIVVGGLASYTTVVLTSTNASINKLVGTIEKQDVRLRKLEVSMADLARAVTMFHRFDVPRK